MGSTAVPIRGRTPFLQSCSLELPMLLQRLAISGVAMVDMAMEDMVAMGATGMERDLLKLKLMLNQDIPEDMVDMDIAVKFVPLFIISPPPSLIFLLVLRQKNEKNLNHPKKKKKKKKKKK